MISHLYVLGALVYFQIAGGQDNLLAQIRNDISVSMSTRWLEWYASNAVDGNETTLANICKCCAATNKGPSWWRLNLGKHYWIKTIIFIGRSDRPTDQSRKFSIYKGFSNSSSGQQWLHTNTAENGYRFTIDLNPQVELQYLEVNKSGVLSICELKVEKGECPSGQFGYPYSCQQCGNCKDNVVCDPTTGSCPNGCQLGYTGTFCKQRCDDGRFGVNCLNECHCQDQEACNKETGRCSSGLCAKGWKGSTCSIKCLDGNFGQKCLSTCHCQKNELCNHINGSCPNDLCAPGWKELDFNTEKQNFIHFTLLRLHQIVVK